MKHLSFFLIFCISLSLSATKLQATNCDEDTPGCTDCSAWSTPDNFKPSIVSGIYDDQNGYASYFKVEYKIRYCICSGDTVWQLKLDEIEDLSGDWSQFSKDAYITRALQELLVYYGAIFDEDLPYSVMIYVPSCMNKTSSAIEACDDVCCKAKYDLSWDSANDEIDLDQVTTYTAPTDPCTGGTGDNCARICSLLDLPTGTLYDGSPYGPTCSVGLCSGSWEPAPYPYYLKWYNGSCWLQIYYHKRYCSGNSPPFEIRIDRVIDGSYGAYCSYDAGDGDDIIMDQAVEFICDQVFEIFPSFYDYDELLVRIARCWEEIQNSSGDVVAIYPCDVDDCCEYEFEIYSYDGDRYGKQMDESGSGTNCTSPCSNYCNLSFIDDQDYELLPKRSGQMDFGNKIRNIEGVETFAVPNPADNTVELGIVSELEGRCEVFVFDNTGRIVHSRGTEKSGLRMVSKVDLKGFSSGIYYYQYIVNGEKAGGGTFVISK